MPVNLTEPAVLLPVPGFRVAGVSAGIKARGGADLALIEIAPTATAAAVFTTNRCRAAPVVLARERVAATEPRYLLINSGNANAGTGDAGLQDAAACCQALADLVGCPAAAVLPYSTGVIGERLPVAKLAAALPDAVARLRDDGWHDAARAIMTTDIVLKGCSRGVDLGDASLTVTGIAKGSGMIHPKMATMLAFICVDARLSRHLLAALLKGAVDESFNRITVDGDTSTNDAVTLVASGRTGPEISDPGSPEYLRLQTAVVGVCRELAQAIVRDGEGATKFITLVVEGAASEADAQRVAFRVANSPLVKTACFAGDPNWGRILAAVGSAGVDRLDAAKVGIYLGDVRVVTGGALDAGYREEQGKAAMAADELTIRIDLGEAADARTRVWTCDYSYDYVRINASYRS